jgi:hypothetical protein
MAWSGLLERWLNFQGSYQSHINNLPSAIRQAAYHNPRGRITPSGRVRMSNEQFTTVGGLDHEPLERALVFRHLNFFNFHLDHPLNAASGVAIVVPTRSASFGVCAGDPKGKLAEYVRGPPPASILAAMSHQSKAIPSSDGSMDIIVRGRSSKTPGNSFPLKVSRVRVMMRCVSIEWPGVDCEI